MTVRGVSRGAGIADYGLVLTGELDDDSLSYDGAATDGARASQPALAEVVFDWRSGYVRLSGDVSHADVEVVGS
jgi:N-methylhydantoinase B